MCDWKKEKESGKEEKRKKKKSKREGVREREVRVDGEYMFSGDRSSYLGMHYIDCCLSGQNWLWMQKRQPLSARINCNINQGNGEQE